MSDLIINGIDHSKFDLEWANHGGIIKVYSLVYKQPNTIHQYEDMSYFGVAKFIDDEPDGTVNVYMLNKRTAENKNTKFLAMATPSECAEAGIEYIEPPARWLPIETMQADIDSLEAQLAEARKDSERFEWMVSYDGEVRNLSCTGNSYCYAVYSEKNGDLNYEYSIYGKTPREAIDKAMKGG